MKKFTKKLIAYRMITNILVSFAVSIFTFSTLIGEQEQISDELFRISIISSIATFIFSYIILIVYTSLFHKMSGYELTENEIICVKGVLFKKKSILEYKKIHAINSKQNFIEKIFGISTLQIDSGSTNTAHSAEIQIIETHETVLKLMQIIKQKQNNEDINISEEQNISINQEENEKRLKSVYDFNTKMKAIYSALTGGVVIALGIISLILLTIIFVFLIALRQAEISIFLMTFLIVLAIYIAFTILGFIVSLISSLIMYHDFKLSRNKNNIEVSYGLFTRVNNTFKYNKIKAIRITQNIIQRLFGFVSIKVEVIGYTVQNNNENQAQSAGVLVPLCKKSDVNAILDELLPNYKPDERTYKPKEYRPFYSYHLIFSLITFILIELFLGIFLLYYNYITECLLASSIMMAVYLIYLSIMLIDRKLAFNNAGFSLANGKLTVFRGSVTKEIVVMRRQNIIGIDSKTTYYREKKNINTYKIHFKSNSFSNTITVLNLDKNEGDAMYKLIRY